jgi:cysteine desulfurase
MTRVYLDHNATSPLRPEARAAWTAWLSQPAANPSSLHAPGRAARARIDRARREVAALVGARPHEVVFTGSGTEACHLAITGCAPRIVVTTAIEHAAVRVTVAGFERDGALVLTVPVGASGRVDAAAFLAAVDEALELARSGASGVAVTCGASATLVLAICMWANNETGVLQPIAEIAAGCAEREVTLFVDACQAVGRVPVNLAADLPGALVALSAHKIGGPAGVGALVVPEGMRLSPIVAGGGQEGGLRGGTENSPGIVAFGAAAFATGAKWAAEAAHMARITETLRAAVGTRIPQARIAGLGPWLPNTTQFLVPHDDEEMLILSLDRAGYAVSAGSACASGAHERSRVLRAMGVLEKGWASIRVSIGPDTTKDDVLGFAEALAAVVATASGATEARR